MRGTIAAVSARVGRRFGIVVAGAALAMTACTSDQPRPSSSPGTVPNERVSTDNALPAEFPAEFPLPAARTVLYSAVSPIGVVVYFQSRTSGDALKTTLLTGLKDRGWTLHACVTASGGVEPVTTIVAGKGRTVATVVVGYAPDQASRIQGRVYTFYVSVATDAAAPLSTAAPC